MKLTQRRVCVHCEDAPALKHSDLCGICEILEAGTMNTELPGAVPAHWNAALGKDIEDRDHLKREAEEAVRTGLVDDWY
jgi:hypothetical protein